MIRAYNGSSPMRGPVPCPVVLVLWQADVTVQLTPEDGVDDITYNVINTLLEFIDSNPPKWQKWKEKANQAGIEWA